MWPQSSSGAQGQGLEGLKVLGLTGGVRGTAV